MEPKEKLTMETPRALNRPSTHIESVANAAVGLVVAQVVLWWWGVPMHEAVGLNAVLFGTSYARSYLLRRAFEKTGDELVGRGWRGWG